MRLYGTANGSGDTHNSKGDGEKADAGEIEGEAAAAAAVTAGEREHEARDS